MPISNFLALRDKIMQYFNSAMSPDSYNRFTRTPYFNRAENPNYGGMYFPALDNISLYGKYKDDPQTRNHEAIHALLLKKFSPSDQREIVANSLGSNVEQMFKSAINPGVYSGSALYSELIPRLVTNGYGPIQDKMPADLTPLFDEINKRDKDTSKTLKRMRDAYLASHKEIK